MASTIMDLPAANAALKEHYDDYTFNNMAYAKNPGLALIPKNEKAGGKVIPFPTQFEVGQGRSSTFANAQGNQTPNQYASFLMVRKSDYAIATIDNQTLEASANDVDAFISEATAVVNGAVRASTISAASGLFRSGTGSIGQVGAVTSGVITLTNPGDVVQFAVGQTLQASATDGAAPRAALGYVIGRSIRQGTVTVSATAQGGAAGSPASWAAADFLLVQGDSNAKMSGLPAWLPLVDPVSTDNFYGTNRSADYRLFGINYDGSGQPIEEALIDHTLLLAREGSDAETFITNFGSMAALTKALGTRREYVNLQGPAEIGFEGIKIQTGTGTLTCLADRSCQVQAGFVLKLDTWKLLSLGSVPRIFKYDDGNTMLRVYNSDSAEVRVGYYGNLACSAPGWNGQIKLSA